MTKINNIKNFSLLLVLSAVITVTLTTPNDSFATIIDGEVTGGSAKGTFELVTIPIPGPNGDCPDNSVGKNCQQTQDLWAFDEDQNITLTAPLAVDDIDGLGVPVAGVLLKGTMVASHYVYFDPRLTRTIEGCIQFDSPVLATIFSTSKLAASDFLANTGVNYLNPGLRGFEGPDSATFTGSEVCVMLRAASPGDYFRVLTELSPGAEPTVSIDNVPLAEGDSGTTAFEFKVTRSDNIDAISVVFATADGTATTADNDYTAAGGTLSFSASGLLTKIITVQVNGDTTVEPDETFFVDLTNCGGCGFTDDQGLGTIQNDDGPVLEADLSISKLDNIDPILAGNTLTYTVTVDNDSLNTAQNVVVTETLPAGVIFVKTIGCAEDPNGVPTCNLGTITGGSFKQYTVEVTVDSGTSGTIINQVSVTSDTTDPDTRNNVTTEDTTVNPDGEPDVDIEIDKCVTFVKGDIDGETGTTCDAQQEGGARSLLLALEGQTVFFRIDAIRTTGVDATGVKVKDLLPAGLEFVNSEPTGNGGGSYDSSSGIWSVGTIGEAGSRSLLIEAKVATGTCGTTLVNIASLSAVVQVEGPTGNNQDSARVQVELTAQEEDCPTKKSKGAGGHEPPTIGKNYAGTNQIVTNGMCIDDQFRTVTQLFHEEMKLIQLLTSPHTISNTIFCNEGVQECNYIGIAFTTKDFDFNDPVMKVEAKKTNGGWAISWYDPQDFIQDPDDAIPGEITFTALIDDNFLFTSFTIVFKNKDTGELVIGIQVRDVELGVRTFWFNEGVEFKDSDAYPSIETTYENPLEIDSLCLNEDPDYRYSCAFAKKVQLEIERAEKLLAE